MLKNIKRFFELILIEPKYFWKNIAIETIFSTYAIFSVFFIKEIIWLIEVWNISGLKNYIIFYVGFNILYFIVLFFVRHWGWADTYYHHTKMIHQKYMKKFNDLDNTYIENIWTGKALSIISKWIFTWNDLAIDVIQKPTNLIISLWAAFFILSEIGYIYIIIFILLFFLLHLIVYFLNEKALNWRKWRIDMMVEYDKQLVKMIMSKFEILQNWKIDKEINVLDKYCDKARYFNLKLNNYLILMFSLPSLVFFIITLSLLILLTKITISFSILISFFMILWILKNNMSDSIEFFKNFTKLLYHVEKMWDLFDNWTEIKWLTTWKNFLYKSGNIEIKNLNFSYWENKIFENFSINIAWSKKTALVWISWSWKTTLVKLISGFITPNSWDIIIDWQNLKEVNLNSYYKNIGYLTQEPSVFDGTILDNLTYWIAGNIENDLDNSLKEKINKAIISAKCEFIYDFKNWLDTEIWERWVRLSWWQKQRLAIAKLFIKDPHIIILDEPTRALDSFSEESISDSFEKLFDKRTVFIIAHRLQTVKNADDIIVFDKWNIVERWNHLSLINHNWYYKKMLDLQSGF